MAVKKMLSDGCEGGADLYRLCGFVANRSVRLVSVFVAKVIEKERIDGRSCVGARE